MHILLTRPLEDSKELIIKLTNLGHKVSHMPVIQIEKFNYKIEDYSNFKGIIFTSANAIKFLETRLINKKTALSIEIMSSIIQMYKGYYFYNQCHYIHIHYTE